MELSQNEKRKLNKNQKDVLIDIVDNDKKISWNKKLGWKIGNKHTAGKLPTTLIEYGVITPELYNDESKIFYVLKEVAETAIRTGFFSKKAVKNNIDIRSKKIDQKGEWHKFSVSIFTSAHNFNNIYNITYYLPDNTPKTLKRNMENMSSNYTFAFWTKQEKGLLYADIELKEDLAGMEKKVTVTAPL